MGKNKGDDFLLLILAAITFIALAVGIYIVIALIVIGVTWLVVKLTKTEQSELKIKKTTESSNIAFNSIDKQKQIEQNSPSKYKWIDEDENIIIAGIELKRGNFYLGEKYLIPKKYLKDQSDNSFLYASVVNPKLEISSINTYSYKTYSSYTDMTPYLRYQFLLWLSGDVSINEVSLDILLLYLFGLEIKMFFDTETTENQRISILKNVIDLKIKMLNCSTLNKSDLESYFNKFIDCAISKYFFSTSLSFVSKEELSKLKVYQELLFFNRISNENIISSDLAYSLTVNNKVCNSVVPEKYQSYLKNRFHYFFNLKYKQGISISPDKHKIPYNYFLMYRSNTTCVFQPEKKNTYIYTPICNLYAFYKSTELLISLVYRDIEEEFSPYFYFYTKNKDKENLFAIFNLPDYINILEDKKVITFKSYLNSYLNNKEYAIIQVDELLKQMEYSRKQEKSLYQKYIDTIIKTFNLLGYGIVPNYNIDKTKFSFGEKVVIYRNSECETIQPCKNYSSMVLLLKMASRILSTDKITCKDRIFLNNHIYSQINDSINQKHLTAYLEWLITHNSHLSRNIKDEIGFLFNESQRLKNVNILFELCFIGGNTNTKRIKMLEKLLPFWNINSSNIHSLIHSTPIVQTDSFVTIKKHTDAKEFDIPKKIAREPKLHLNEKFLQIIERETEASQRILSEIFDNEALPVNNEAQKLQEYKDEVRMLKILFAKESWERKKFEEICQHNEVMAGSILEKINDYAYSKIQDAVIEDDGETLYVRTDYKNKLI